MWLSLDCRIISLFKFGNTYFHKDKIFFNLSISIIPKCDCIHKSYNSPFCLGLDFANILVVVVVIVKLWNVPEKSAFFWLQEVGWPSLTEERSSPSQLFSDHTYMERANCEDNKMRQLSLRCSNYWVTCLPSACVFPSLHTLYILLSFCLCPST